MSVGISPDKGAQEMSLRLWRAFAWGLLFVTTFPQAAVGQQGRSSSADELLKIMGLVAPAISGAPDFNLLDADGNPMALSGFRGRWVLLNFWATWCEPCREEMPSMELLSRQFTGQGLAVLAVNQRENAALVKQFMQAYRLTFTALLDTTGRVSGYYRVYGIPASYLIDANGQALGMKSGPMDWSSGAVLNGFRKLLGVGTSASRARGSAKPLPDALRATGDGIAIRNQQDRLAGAIGTVGPGELLTPLGKVSGADDSWYMVKRKNGDVGWIRARDVEEVKPGNSLRKLGHPTAGDH
jgi:peroxiredoxin